MLKEIYKWILKRFCTPLPGVLEDLEAVQRLEKRNIYHFFILILVLVGLSARSLFYELSAVQKLQFWNILLSFTGLLLFGRTRPKLHDFWCTLSLCSISFQYLVDVEAGIIRNLISMMTYPLWIMLMTNNWKFYLLGSVIIYINMKYLCRSLVVDFIVSPNPMRVAEDFYSNFNTAYLVNASVILAIFRNLTNVNQTLKKSKTETENAYNKLKGFINTFSHELRNPLNSILGNLQLAIFEELKPQVKDYLSSAEIGCQMLLQIINNILDSCKAEIMELDCNPRPVNIREQISKMWKISSEIISHKGLNGNLRINSDVPKILQLDNHRLDQIFLNLVGNSVKFTDKGSISIDVSWKPNVQLDDCYFKLHPYNIEEEGIFEKDTSLQYITSSKNQYDFLNLTKKEFSLKCSNISTIREDGILEIIFKDTGCGIKKDDLEKLFQQFVQLSTDLRIKQKGTGLGLHITREIINKMGGHIKAFSQESIGTTMIVCIPTFSCPIETREMSSAEIHSVLKKKLNRVLIVDDVSYNIFLINKFLKSVCQPTILGYPNGSSCIEEFKLFSQKAVKVDLVITDFDMPIMNGRKLAQKIREYEEANQLVPCKIVIISGNDLQDIKELMDQKGEFRISLFLKKPILKDHFLDNIAKFLSE